MGLVIVMQFRRLFRIALVWLHTVTSGRAANITVGAQAILGNTFNPTFTSYLQSQTPYNFQLTSYTDNDLMLNDARKGRLNLTFAGPVQYLCLSLAATTSDGVSELVSSSYVDGAPVERLSGAIVVRDNSTLESVQDIRGKTVLTGPVASLTTFAAQWQVVQAQNISLFAETRAVFLQNNITQLLLDLQSGVGDVAFVPSSYLERYFPGDSSFRLLNPQVTHGFPYMHSTSLFPNAVLSALDTTPFDVRRAIAQALFRISPNDTLAQDGMFYGFTPLGAYTQVRTLMASIGLLNNQTQCRTINTLTDAIQCPQGYTATTVGSCQARNITCPAGYQCVCSPCSTTRRIFKPLGLSVPAFSAMLCVLVMLLFLICFVCVRLYCLRRRPDPYWELALHTATIIGESSNGHVFGTEWKGQKVAVKRLFPPPAGVRSVFDDGGSGLSWLNLQRFKLRQCFWLNNPVARNMMKVKRRMELHHGSVMPIVGYSTGESGREILVITPRMEAGTVSDLLATGSHVVDLSIALSIASDVAHAVHFLQRCRPPVLGVNLKPHHLFVDDSLRILLGVSFRPPTTHSVWAPPECIRGDSPWTPMADVYAYSMLLYTLVHKQLPFEGRKSSELLMAIQDADEQSAGDARPRLGGHSPLESLITACWAQNPSHRPTFADIKLHLANMMQKDKAGRPSMNLSPDQVSDVRQTVPTDHYPCVTIFFSDIVGFTEISAVLEPLALKEMLDELYSFMDGVANELEVYKLETAGDALLAVTNVLKPQEDHAPRMARFALKVLAGVSNIPVNPSLRSGATIQLRVGLHSGPVVGGVAGISNVRYCLYGHAMNIASRMESTGEAGRIQLTEFAASLVSKDVTLANRIVARPGLTPVKGQQPMRTSWLLTDSQLKMRKRQ